MLGTKILEERKSKYNNNIKVVRSLGFGTYIQVNNLTQSGGVVTDFWRTTLKKLQNSKHPSIQNCLILGLGGGTVAKLIRKYYPKAKITGVEIDPAMVELGTRYLALDTSKTKIIIQDAFDYCLVPNAYRKAASTTYDLVIVDLYVGDKVPKKFESERFHRLVHGLLTDSGIAVFNRLYFGDKRTQAVKFGQKLQKVFPEVDVFYPEANIMYICCH